MHKKLEEIKQLGMYAIQIWFGRDIGCDDLGEPLLDRPVQLTASPVGCLGETKILFKGSVAAFLDFNFKTRPKKLNNPPDKKDYEEDGYYIWGTERSVDDIIEKCFE